MFGTFRNLADSNEMPRPRSQHHPDRELHAEEALEGAFIALARDAERHGWTRDEAAFALLNLAVARIQMIDAMMETDEAIARAVRNVQGLT